MRAHPAGIDTPPMTDFPNALNHVALTVTDLEASREWYRRLLGADPVIDEDVAANAGHHKGFHHTIFLLPSGIILALHLHDETDGAHRFDELRPGLNHIGFGCADRDELVRLAARLDEMGVEHGGIAEDHLGYAIAFRDPDNIALEFWAARS
jgi:catechol 2,3-dioxygenase-like lactoylglutathione lyase family enzyme